MVNRQRFLLDDLDSEGFPVRYSIVEQYAGLHVNKDGGVSVGYTPLLPGDGLSHSLLADVQCNRCAIPLGWQEVDGVVLPRITWAERA